MEEILAYLVSHVWPWRRVPDVVGRSVPEASSRLTMDDLEPGVVSEDPAAVVVAQEPSAGSRRRKGARVSLFTNH